MKPMFTLDSEAIILKPLGFSKQDLVNLQGQNPADSQHLNTIHLQLYWMPHTGPQLSEIISTLTSTSTWISTSTFFALLSSHARNTPWFFPFFLGHLRILLFTEP